MKTVITAPARIRMPELVWRFIVEESKDDQPDPLQAHLARLIHENPDAQERILVTRDDDLLDLLRDWCARMITTGMLVRANGDRAGAELVTEASRVFDLIDRHDAKRLNGA